MAAGLKPAADRPAVSFDVDRRSQVRPVVREVSRSAPTRFASNIAALDDPTPHIDTQRTPQLPFKPSNTDAGTIAEMDARSDPGLTNPFDEAIDDALSSLPANLRAAMNNVEIVVEDEPPAGQPLLGLYRGVPLLRRSSTYSGVLPDMISIFSGPITRLAGSDADRLDDAVICVAPGQLPDGYLDRTN